MGTTTLIAIGLLATAFAAVIDDAHRLLTPSGGHHRAARAVRRPLRAAGPLVALLLLAALA